MFQLNTTSISAIVESVKDLPGKLVVGRHKNAGKVSRVVSLEVTAIAAIPTRYGLSCYLVGTVVDDPRQAGRVVSMKLLGFNFKSMEVLPVDKFVPIDLKDYYVRTPDMAQDVLGQYDWMEKLAPEDVEQAVEDGMCPLADYIVAGAKPKARKAKKTVEVAA